MTSPPDIYVATPVEDESAETRDSDQGGAEHDEPVCDGVEVIDELGLPLQAWRGLMSMVEWCFGLISLLLGLAILATAPVLNMLSLGYFLEASGRVARTGNLLEGFVGVRKAARIGGMVLGSVLMLLPLWLVSDYLYTARLIDPESVVVWRLTVGLVLMTVALLGHVTMAWYCGGKLRHFFWPLWTIPAFFLWMISGRVNMEGKVERPPLDEWFPPATVWAGLRRGEMLDEASNAFWEFVGSLRLPHYFWLGARGFVGAFLWLAAPVGLLFAATHIPNQALGVLCGLVGGAGLTIVLLYLPFLQVHFAVENRFAAMFEVGRVRELFRRAPIAYWMALLVTLLFALPLYLLKIEWTPAELAWLPALVFVVFIYPARLLTGWAVGRSLHYDQPRFFLFRWAARLAALPVAAIYTLIIFFTQFLTWYGGWSLFEQHAFLTPAPFFGG